MPTATPIPARSKAQRLEALKLANGIRSTKATVKRAVKRGTCSAIAVIKDPPEALTAREFLLQVPGVGEVKATKALQLADIKPTKRLTGLTDNQRSRLITVVRNFGR